MMQLTRDQLIDKLRQKLLELADEDHSICEVAARCQIFCRGFRRLKSEELRSKYHWLEEKAHRPLTRGELEERANVWELARQIYHDVPIACDAEQQDRDQCTGWDGFTDENLAEFHQELCGEAVEVVSGKG